MQDKKDKLDELYRNKLKDFKLPVSDKVFANVKKEVAAAGKTNKMKFGYWLIASILFLGTTAACYFVSASFFAGRHAAQVNLVSIDSLNEKQNAINTIASPAAETKSVKANATEEKNTENTKTTEVNNNPSVKTESSMPTSPNSITKDGSSVNPKSGQNEKAVTGNNKPSATVSPTKKETPKQVESRTKTNKQDNEPATIQSESSVEKNTKAKPVLKKDNVKPTEIAGKNKTETIANTSSEKEASEAKTKEDVMNSGHPNKTEVAAKSITDSTSIIHEKLNAKTEGQKNDSIQKAMLAKAEDSIQLKKSPVPPLPDNKTADKKIGFYLELVGGPSFSYRTLSTGSNDGAANRNDNEKKQTTYNAGIGAGMILKNNLFASIGVRINNKSESYHMNSLTGRTDTTLIPIWDSTHTTIIGDSAVLHKVAGTPENSVVNHYQFLSIPIMIGYRFTVKDKLFIAPSIGLGIDYLLSATSSWTDTKTKEIITYSKAGGNFASVTLSGRVNVDIGYNLSPHWSILLQPGYTRSLQSIYKKEDELKLLPYSYDVNFAVRYKFK